MQKRIWIFAICLLAFGLVSAIPQDISINGKLTDSSGQALDGSYSVDFKIYNQATGGSALWSDSKTIETNSNGVYYTTLKDVNLSFDEDYYLGINVESDGEMSPRINLSSSPYAFRANVSDYLDANRNYQVGNMSAGYFIGDGSLLSNVNYTETDPYYFSNPNAYYNSTTLDLSGYAQYEFSSNNFNGSGDIITTGNVTAGNLNIANWDTAYGWGNHAGAGYWKSDGTSTATGNWDLGDYEFKSGIIKVDDYIESFGIYNYFVWGDDDDFIAKYDSTDKWVLEGENARLQIKPESIGERALQFHALRNNDNAMIRLYPEGTGNAWLYAQTGDLNLAAVEAGKKIIASDDLDLGSNDLTTTGNITATSFIGDGSQLTGID
ncbi:MAG: hypothetical protein ACP5D2_01045, partial [Candidatus Nanoarchaeia archaeon]